MKKSTMFAKSGILVRAAERVTIGGALVAALVLLMGADDCCKDGYRTTAVTLTREQWTQVLEDTFAGVSLRLNNYTPTEHQPPERAFHKFRDALLEVDIPVPPMRFDIPVQKAAARSLYINDMTLELSSMRMVNEAMIFLRLESEGDEIIADCVGSPCPCGDRRIDLGYASMAVHLDLGSVDGRLAINRVWANMTAEAQAGSCTPGACMSACNIFAHGSEGKAKLAIETSVENFFEAHKEIIARKLEDNLRAHGVTGEIQGFIGPSIIVRREDPTCE